MDDILADLTRRLIAFRDERDWARFHTPRDLALSVGIEAGELMELFQWADDAETARRLADPAFRERLGEETADVLLYLLLLCERTGVDLGRAAHRKIDTNARRYPADKARGTARKYTEL